MIKRYKFPGLTGSAVIARTRRNMISCAWSIGPIVFAIGREKVKAVGIVRKGGFTTVPTWHFGFGTIDIRG